MYEPRHVKICLSEYVNSQGTQEPVIWIKEVFRNFFFFIFAPKTNFLSTHWNCLTRSTHKICFGEKRELCLLLA